jgi:putative ABC transport system permease protein
MKFLGLITSNLKRKKLRTALTLLSILVAFLLFGFLCALREALSGGVNLAGADRIVARNKVSIIQSLPLSYESRIASLPGVDAVVHESWFGGIYQDPKNFFPSMATEPEKFLNMFPEFVVPKEQQEAWKRTRAGVILGRTTANRFHFKIGDHIPLTSPIWGQPENKPNWDFEIMGIYDGGKRGMDTTQMLFQYDYFDEARTRGKGEVGWFTVRVKDPNQAAQVAHRIDDEFANSPYETKAEPEGAFAESFAQQLGDIGAITMAVTSAVFFTILLIAGNTMWQAVRERTEELGVLKAMGFTNEGVLALVLAESLLVAVIGGLAGLGIAWAVLAGGSPVPSLLPLLYLPAKDLVAGALPSIEAMRLKIAEALRRNG